MGQPQPPQGYTPLEAALMMKGRIVSADFTALLLYWAHQGILSIREKSGAFAFIKTGALPEGAKAYERHLWGKLFASGDQADAEDIRAVFYAEYREAKAMVRSILHDQALVTRRSDILLPVLVVLAALPVFVALSAALIGSGMDWPSVFLAALMTFGVVLPFFYTASLIKRRPFERRSVRNLRLISGLFLCALGFGIYSIMIPVSPEIAWSIAAASLVLGLCAYFAGVYTPQGAAIAGSFLALMRAISRPQGQPPPDTTAFYNVLPFAACLNLLEAWCASYALSAPPPYYDGYAGAFSPAVFVQALEQSLYFS
jgi:hypothetical protein